MKDPKKLLWGFDLGGTKIEGAVLDRDYNVLVRKRIPTGAENGYEFVLNQIKTLLDDLSNEVGTHPSKIGIGTPGTTDPQTGLLKNCNAQSINGNPFLNDLQKMLGIDVKMANDANCFALAEAVMGAVPEKHPDAKVVFGVIMGTGVGGGIVVNGKVINGRQGIGGEWGHTFLNEEAGKCYCGDTGCTERLIAGPHLERYYEEITGTKKSLKEIYQLYKDGADANATKTIDRLIHYFGLGLSNIVNVLDPDVIVLGGGVSNLDVLYKEGVESVKKHVFNTTFDTPIIKPRLGDSAGVFGAALL